MTSTDEALVFFQGLYGAYFGQGDSRFLSLSQRDPEKNRFRNEFHSNLFFAAHRAGDMAASGKDAYFAVNPMALRARRKNSIQDLVTVHVDADFASKDGLSRLRTLEPSAIVSSGGRNRFHGYWFLDAPLSKDRFGPAVENLNRQATEALGLKQEAWDLSRLLRVPGTANYKKPSHPRPVQIEDLNSSRRYSIEQLSLLLGFDLKALAVPSDAVSQNLNQPTAPRGIFLNAADRAYLKKLLDVGLFEERSRNRAFMILTRHYYGEGFGEQDINRLLIEFVEHRSNGLSRDWNSNPDFVRANAATITANWFKKVRPTQTYIYKRQERHPVELSAEDMAFLKAKAEQLNLDEKARAFLSAALKWILTMKRGDHLIMSVINMKSLPFCHANNYKDRRQLLFDCGILKFRVRHERKDGARLADEFTVTYNEQPPRNPMIL